MRLSDDRYCLEELLFQVLSASLRQDTGMESYLPLSKIILIHNLLQMSYWLSEPSLTLSAWERFAYSRGFPTPGSKEARAWRALHSAITLKHQQLVAFTLLSRALLASYAVDREIVWNSALGFICKIQRIGSVGDCAAVLDRRVICVNISLLTCFHAEDKRNQ